MPYRNIIFLFIIATISFCASGQELFDMNRTSVRALGMGNAIRAAAMNSEALFYNPAGLARNGGISWTLLDVNVGASNFDTITDVQNVLDSSGDDFTAAIEALYGKYIWAGGHGKTAVALPFMAAALYGTGDVSMSVENPAVPELQANVVYDTGLAIGAALPLGPVHFGAVAKSIRRTGTRKLYGVTELASLDSDQFAADFDNTGVGFSLDLGLNFVMPGPIAPIFSLVYHDVGITSFSGGVNAPPSDDPNLVVGAGMIFNLPGVDIIPALDLRYADRSDIDLARKLNFGVEVDLPVIDLRAGFSQGYYTYGFGLGLGLMRIEAASYGVEIGTFAGQKEDRRYVVQLAFEIGFDAGLGAGSGGSSASGGKGGPRGSQGSSRTFFGSGVKQRR